MSFNEKGYEIVYNVISKDVAEHISYELETLKNSIYAMNNIPEDSFNGDIQVANAHSVYGSLPTDTLLRTLLPVMQNVTGKTLYPTYSFSRIYYNGATMAEHRDRPSCQYSATLTLQCEEPPWDIWMESFDGSYKPLKLPVGSMCVYRGDKLTHKRDEFMGQKQIQCFLHFVDANGEYADHKLDGRPALATPHLSVSGVV